MNSLEQTDCIFTVRHLSHSSTLTGELLVALKSHTKMVITASAVPPGLILSSVKKYGVTILCINPGVYSVNVEPNTVKEASYMSRYNTMRNVENQSKGCPS